MDRHSMAAMRRRAHPPEVMAKLAIAESADTVISRADSGKTLRQIRTSWTDSWEAPDAPKPLGMPYQDILVGDILGQIERHHIEPLMHTPAGQSIAYFNEQSTVGAVMAALVEETLQALASLR